jgi:hypothetical protein
MSRTKSKAILCPHKGCRFKGKTLDEFQAHAMVKHVVRLPKRNRGKL